MAERAGGHTAAGTNEGNGQAVRGRDPGPPVAERLVGADLEDFGDVLRAHFVAEAFPWKQIIGYAGSLALTVVALVMVVDRVMPIQPLIAAILVLAGIQAGWQLGFFMHLREARGPAWHIGFLAFGGATALLVVVFSIWIMTFKWGVS